LSYISSGLVDYAADEVVDVFEDGRTTSRVVRAGNYFAYAE
jgi:hypothetical protein